MFVMQCKILGKRPRISGLSSKGEDSTISHYSFFNLLVLYQIIVRSSAQNFTIKAQRSLADGILIRTKSCFGIKG